MAVGDIISAAGTGTLLAGLTIATWGAIIATFVGAIILAYGVFLLVTNGDRTTGMSLVASGVFLIIVAWVVKYFLGTN